jgi:hypothetical protein
MLVDRGFLLALAQPRDAHPRAPAWARVLTEPAETVTSVPCPPQRRSVYCL